MEAQIMTVLWIGLSIFAIIVTGFFITMRITKGVFFLLNGQGRAPLRSSLVPVPTCSGDDSLGHPDLKKLSELQEASESVEVTEDI